MSGYSHARPRYVVSASAGTQGKNHYAVLDRHDMQGGKGMRRVSFHATYAAAQKRAKEMNTFAAKTRADIERWARDNARVTEERTER